MVQPQVRFTYLWPLRIANLTFIIAAGLHVLSCLESKRPLIRLGPGTILALLLLFFGTLSQYFGIYQLSTAWNPFFDTLVKNSLLLIMIEAMAISIERVWAIQMVSLVCTLWWIKAGLRLSATGATYAADRLMGAAVTLIENPNGFAYMMCVFLPLYLYTYQQATKKWQKWLGLACALSAVWIIFETGSRTGMVALIAVSIFLLPHYGRRHQRALIVLATIAVLVYPMTGEKNRARFRTIPQSFKSFVGIGHTSAEQTRAMTQDEQSAEERRAKNRDTWALIKAYPAFGVGLNPDSSKYTDQFPMASGQVHFEMLMAGRQMGFIGISLYLSLILLAFAGGYWIRRNMYHWPAVRELGWTFQIQALAIMVGGSFAPWPWHAPMMMLAGSASALLGLCRREQAHGLPPLGGYTA